jgi:hypothetical protein
MLYNFEQFKYQKSKYLKRISAFRVTYMFHKI